MKRKQLRESSSHSLNIQRRRITRATARKLSNTSFTSLNCFRKTRKPTIRLKQTDFPSCVPTIDTLQNTVTLPIPEEQLLNNKAYINQTSVFNGIQPDILNYVDEFGDGTVQISKPDPNINTVTSNDCLVVNEVLDMMEQYGLLESDHRDINFSELHEELMSDGESVTDTQCEPLVIPNHENKGSTV